MATAEAAAVEVAGAVEVVEEAVFVVVALTVALVVVEEGYGAVQLV